MEVLFEPVIQIIQQLLAQLDSSYIRVVRILTCTLRFGRLIPLCATVGRLNRFEILVLNHPFVEVFADWASNSNADETSRAMRADSRVNLAAAVRTSKSKRIRGDLHFSLRR